MRTCTETGLNLIASTSQTTHRISQTKYGALNPPPRPLDGDRSSWGRWDVPGHRTVYAASSETAAFSEVISYITPDLPKQPLANFFDDVTLADNDTLDEQIAAELPQHGAMASRSISKGWRDERSSYTLTLPDDGWFVDVSASQSISAIGLALADELLAYEVPELTLGVITGSLDKGITTTIAAWIHSRVLDDGTLPHGIVYRSKWGAEWRSWAIWLRKVDDGSSINSEPTKQAQIDGIGKHSKALREAAELRNMRIY
ncbi:RES family NAD+ phosphorylase [Rhodococcus qingshengii]|uniref:RES family NAD+ phosphorylase n=1 Tax=Rhodococcus qingshengii TaxID=334542 RepID=UPI00237CC7BC|nr:RES family NAD+ phosphorylase [Rhodococcus qingshengii]WCT06089.1 RES family NAD+ phosphorylase [Rhodococcus qingshengii]